MTEIARTNLVVIVRNHALVAVRRPYATMGQVVPMSAKGIATFVTVMMIISLIVQIVATTEMLKDQMMMEISTAPIQTVIQIITFPKPIS